MRRVFGPLALGLVILAAPAIARAECRASPSGSHSYDVRLSPRAGVLCLHVVDVHAGAECEGEPAWSVELGCNVTRRIAIDDHGRLVSILAPRTSRPDWSIVQITGRDQPPMRLGLVDLLAGREPLRGSVRLDFDGAAIRMRARGREEHVSFDAIETLLYQRDRTR